MFRRKIKQNKITDKKCQNSSKKEADVQECGHLPIDFYRFL